VVRLWVSKISRKIAIAGGECYYDNTI